MLIPTISSAEGGQVPPSTNPANRVIFPANGRDTDQQMKDQLESYNWATAQTKWDPYEAHEVLVQKGYAAAQTAEDAQGGLVTEINAVHQGELSVTTDGAVWSVFGNALRED